MPLQILIFPLEPVRTGLVSLCARGCWRLRSPRAPRLVWAQVWLRGLQIKITGGGETLWPKPWCFHTLAQLRLHSLTLKGQILPQIRASSPASHFTPSLLPGLPHHQGSGNVWFFPFPLGSTLTSHFFTSMCFKCWVLKGSPTLESSLGVWGVGLMWGKFNKIGFQEGSLLRLCLTNAWFGSLFPPCFPGWLNR